MAELAAVWFRSDLRVHDNEALARACTADSVLPVYCFDPREFGDDRGMFGLPKTGPYRTRFLRESVADLRASLRERGGELVVRRGRPEELLPELFAEHGVDRVHFQTTPATEELTVENATKAALEEAGIDYQRHWTHTLYHINDLPRDVADMEDTFTPWKDRTEAKATVRDQVPTPGTVPAPDPGPDPGEVPTNEALGVEPAAYDDRGVLAFEGGETAGRERVEQYLWEGDHLRNYKATRNGLLGADYSSKLSAWLAHGCLSPRYVHDEVRRYEDERVSNRDTYWLLFELTWRDFFQFQFIKHGGRFFTPGGIRDQQREWSSDRERFKRWAAGETGVPFVDANMRELNATGYMSNRGRQNVASFLADWLELDWRMGAAYFESRLVDYDPASNWGNWAYQAGVGNDSRNLYFNVIKQANKYDSDGAYVRHWLPELSDVPGDAVHEPWRLSPDQQELYGAVLGEDYPEPVIDLDARHEQLQRER
jgi:deoxyribodipyrimidine photo-lyase